MTDALNAWFDGGCEPINPGGIATYGFVVRARDTLLHAEGGMAATPFKVETTNNVAEYQGLIHCLEWLLAHTPERPCMVHGDSKLVISQADGSWRVKSEHLKPFAAKSRQLLAKLPDVRLRHIPRDENHEADKLTHDVYEAYVDAHPEIHELLPLATPNMLKALRSKGIPTYRYMGRIDAMRLLRRHHEKWVKEQETAGRLQTD